MAHARRSSRLLAVICTLVGGGGLRPGIDGHVEHLGHTSANETDFNCARATMGKDSPYRMPLAEAETDPQRAARLTVLPPEARNRLTPVWLGADPDHLYPSFVFRMLTFPAAAGGRSPRDQLLETWRRKLDEQSSDAADRSAAERLLLGQGGVYDDDLLTLRADMFEGLESAVNGMTRDLELLDRSLVRVLGSPMVPEAVAPFPTTAPPAPAAEKTGTPPPP